MRVSLGNALRDEMLVTFKRLHNALMLRCFVVVYVFDALRKSHNVALMATNISHDRWQSLALVARVIPGLEIFYERFWNKWTIKNMTKVIALFHNGEDEEGDRQL